MRRLLVFLTLVAMSFQSGQTLLAWNDLGHMVVARIAYEQLSESERASVNGLLRHHPHYHEILVKDCPPDAREEEWVFLRAATWPDHVRPPRTGTREPVHSHPIYRFHHPTWHYANFEYRAGQRETTLPSRPLPHQPLPHNAADQTDIIEQIDHSYMIIRGLEPEHSEPETTLSPAEDRAVRLCWLFHLIGDIHQPLHVATLVDDRIPALMHGDEGGNKISVRLNHNSEPRKLHAIWDDLLGTHARFGQIIHLAELFSRDPQLAPARLPEFQNHKQAREIASESYQIAKDSVYQNGSLHYALSSRVDSHELNQENVPVLSKQYLQQAQALSARRITLAGYRLADRLKYIVSREAMKSALKIGLSKQARGSRFESDSLR